MTPKNSIYHLTKNQSTIDNIKLLLHTHFDTQQKKWKKT